MRIAKIHLGPDRVFVGGSEPAIQLFGFGPRAEDFFARRLEDAPDFECFVWADAGCGHTDVFSCCVAERC